MNNSYKIGKKITYSRITFFLKYLQLNVVETNNRLQRLLNHMESLSNSLQQ